MNVFANASVHNLQFYEDFKFVNSQTMILAKNVCGHILASIIIAVNSAVIWWIILFYSKENNFTQSTFTQGIWWS